MSFYVTAKCDHNKMTIFLPSNYEAITLVPTQFTAAKSLQLCPTLCDPIPGILQARTLEWVAISFSNA